MRRLIPLVLLFVMGACPASPLRLRVTLARGTSVLVSQLVDVVEGTEAKIDHTSPFALVGGCAGDAHAVAGRLKGEGRQGQVISLRAMPAGQHKITLSVGLEHSEVVSLLPTAAGVCRAQTPAMLKWDASARFQLGEGEANSFSIGEYVVVVTAVALPSWESSPGETVGGFAL